MAELVVVEVNISHESMGFRSVSYSQGPSNGGEGQTTGFQITTRQTPAIE
jgi:hypothetical protein